MLQQYEIQQRQFEQHQLQLYQQERHRQLQLMSQEGGQGSNVSTGMLPQPMMGNLESSEFQQLGGNYLLTPSIEGQLTSSGQYSGDYQHSPTIGPENDDGVSLDQRSSMNLEMPLSPMNPQAATFSPTFSHGKLPFYTY